MDAERESSPCPSSTSWALARHDPSPRQTAVVYRWRDPQCPVIADLIRMSYGSQAHVLGGSGGCRMIIKGAKTMKMLICMKI
jgi:hypothetical protein